MLVSEIVVDGSVGELVFDPAASRLYYGPGPSRFEFVRWVDVGAGDLLGAAHGSQIVGSPPLPSPDGARFFSTREVYDASSLESLGALVTAASGCACPTS